MRLSIGTRLVLCFLVLAGLGAADAAFACYGKCVVVSPPFCRRCLDSETPTGVLCQDSGACGCFYIQCAAAQAPSVQAEAQVTLAEMGLSAPVLASPECSTAPTAMPPLAMTAN